MERSNRRRRLLSDIDLGTKIIVSDDVVFEKMKLEKIEFVKD